MTEARRSFLRDVMQLAWRKFRFERGACDFGAALRNAWAWVKRRGLPPVAAGPVLQLRTMVQSPTHRAMTGQPYAFDRAYRAGRFTSRMGA